MTRRWRFSVLDQLAEQVFLRDDQRPIVGRERTPAPCIWPVDAEISLAVVTDLPRGTRSLIQERLPLLGFDIRRTHARRERNQRSPAGLTGA